MYKMALFTRLTTICNICKVSVQKLSLRVDVRYFAKERRILRILPSNVLQKRHMSIYSMFKRPSIEKLKETDGIPPQYELIYRNTMDKYLLAGQIFSTVCVGIICVVVALRSDLEIATAGMTEGAGKVDNEVLLYLVMLVGFAVAIQVLISRMPIRIYNLPSQEDYIFIFYKSMPFSKGRATCKVNQVVKVIASEVLPWKDSSYKMHNKGQVILIDQYFRKPSDLNVLLGYERSRDDDDD